MFENMEAIFLILNNTMNSCFYMEYIKKLKIFQDVLSTIHHGSTGIKWKCSDLQTHKHEYMH